MVEGRSAFKIVTGKRHLERQRRRGEDNIRMDLEERALQPYETLRLLFGLLPGVSVVLLYISSNKIAHNSYNDS